MRFDASNYGSVLSGLVDTDRLRALDADTAVAGMAGALRGLSIESAFAHTRVSDSDMASCCLAAVCQASVRGKSADGPLLASIQQVEWELLFGHCYAAAIG